MDFNDVTEERRERKRQTILGFGRGWTDVTDVSDAVEAGGPEGERGASNHPMGHFLHMITLE